MVDNSLIKYQKICSARTVQSDQKGFFINFYLEVRQECDEKWLQNTFGLLKTNEARILAIFNDSKVADIVVGILENVQPVFKPKDSVFSMQRRALADKYLLLISGDNNGNDNKDLLQQALNMANLAVMRAPAKGIDMDIDDGLTLAMAFRSRANVLLIMGEGEAALNDLKMTANYGLEIKQSADYYTKLAKAYAYLNEMARAEISLKIAETFSNANSSLIKNCRKEMALIKKSSKILPVKMPQLSRGENVELKCASNLVKLNESKDKGRFIVAADTIKTGDVLLNEPPVAACLLPEFFGSYCHHCFQKLHVPIPCLNCSGLAFCSTQCMKGASDSYHRFECQFMDLFIGSGMSILCYIALRIFTQAPTVENGLNTANSLYETLCTHEDERQVDDYMQRSLMAAFLMRCLQKSQYFGQRKTEGVNPSHIELKVCTALLGLLQVLQYNAHEIYQTTLNPKHIFEKSKIVYIGAGLYRTGAYFNHECWPTVARYFVGKNLMLVATKPHDVNETVAENYGPIFTKINVTERQQSLRGRYLFNCNCLACQENWPTLQKLAEKQVRLRCTSTNCSNVLQFPKDLSKVVRCNHCRKNISLKESVSKLIKVEEIYREAAEAMQQEDVVLAIDLFRKGIDDFFQIAVLPHKNTLMAQLSLMKCLAVPQKRR